MFVKETTFLSLENLWGSGQKAAKCPGSLTS